VSELPDEKRPSFERRRKVFAGIANRNTATVEAAIGDVLDLHRRGFDSGPEDPRELVSLPVTSLVLLARDRGLDVSVDAPFVPDCAFEDCSGFSGRTAVLAVVGTQGPETATAIDTVLQTATTTTLQTATTTTLQTATAPAPLLDPAHPPPEPRPHRDRDRTASASRNRASVLPTLAGCSRHRPHPAPSRAFLARAGL
jgi:hypothetical protein